MRLPKSVRRLFRLGVARPEVRRDVDDELQFHFEEAVRNLMSGGLTEAEARERARERFGDERAYRYALERIDEGRVRMERWALWWDILRQSLVSLARSTRRYPVLTAGVVVTLGLGIGANATMYGIVDRLLLQPPRHVVEADRLRRVFVERERRGELIIGDGPSYPDYADLKAHEGMAVAGYTGSSEETIGNGASATLATIASASAEFFPLLGVSPMRGRFYTTEESAAGEPLTAVVSAEYWKRAYGEDPALLGRTIEISGRTHMVIGVAPFGFTGMDLAKVDIWLPLEATNAAGEFYSRCLGSRGCRWMKTVGRVKDGVAMEAAEAEATRLVVNGRRAEGMTDPVRVLFGSIIAARRPDASAESGLTLWLVGVSVIVLLIACANVANLLTARSTTQRKEIAVRMALGAGRKRVIGQTMVESILLALAGGVLALVLARWGGEIIRSTLLPDVYFPSSAITLRLFGFTTIVALIAGAVAGVVPAIQSSRTDLTEDLSETSLGNSGGRSNLHLFLTNAQAAMSVILLVGAGLFVRSVGEVRSIDLGLDVDRLLQARLEFGAARLADSEWNGLYREAALRVAALPVVRSAAATNAPMGLASQGPLEVPGLDSIPSLPGGGPYWRNVTAGYFETAGVAILRGRPIEESEFDRVAVVSETMASTLWPGRDGLGECLLLNREQDCTTVVGVAEDAARDGFQDAPFMAFYTPVPEDDGSLLAALYVRTEGDAEAALGDVSLLLRSFSPQVRNARVQTVEELLDPQVRQWRIGAVLFSLFGLLAMCLAAIGLYAVLAFDVARRRRELGIRAALGAGKARLLGGVFVRGAQLTLFGVVLGLGVAYLIAPYGRDLLFEVSPRDPGVLIGVALLLVVVTAMGSLLPGVRATRVNPTVALKSE